MFRSIRDPRATETVFACFSRGLKSTCMLIDAGYSLHQEACKILWMWQTIEHGEKFVKESLEPELLDTVDALNYLSSAAGRRNGNTITFKRGPGVTVNIFGANAPGTLRRAKGNRLYADEIDAYEITQTDEGDILVIFDRRGSEYPDTVRVKASYPSLRGHSRIWTRLEGSDFNEWWSTCVRCGGEPFVMHRSQIRYEKERPETATFECPRCGECLNDAERHEMAHGQGFDNWRARNPFTGIHGFHANVMLWPHPVDKTKYPAGALGMIAAEEIAAERSPDAKRSRRVIVNTMDAEPFDPTEESEQPPDWKQIFDARENYGLVVPEKGLFLTAFVDCQLNRLEVGWRAYGKEEESWGMDHVVLEGHVRDREVWEKLKGELKRKFKHAMGCDITLGSAFVDGGAYAEYVYRFFVELAQRPVEGVTGKVRASKGEGKHGMPICVRKMATVAKTLKGHHIGTWAAKDLIYQRLKAEVSPMHYNQRFSEEYCTQLTVETVTIDYDGGQEIRKYENEKNLRNEALDIEVGCLAAFRLYPRNLDAIEAQLREDSEKPDLPVPPTPAPDIQQLMKRAHAGGGNNGWMGQFRS